MVLGPLGHRQWRHECLDPAQRGACLVSGTEPGPGASFLRRGLDERAARLRGDPLRGLGDGRGPLVVPGGQHLPGPGFQAARGDLGVAGFAGQLRGGSQVRRALGSLSEAAGNQDEAVTYRVGALAIRLRIGTATTGHLQALAELRRGIGSDRFRAAALASGIDDESVGKLIEMLDQQEKTTGD